MGGTGKEVCGCVRCPSASGALLILCRNLLREEQYPERCWKKVEQRWRREVSPPPSALEEGCEGLSFGSGRRSPGRLPPCEEI